MNHYVVLHNAQDGHISVLDLWNKWLKPNLIEQRKIVLEARYYEDAKTDEQRRYYHAVVLDTIARNKVINGQKYPMRIWKEFFRDKFLGVRRKTVVNPMTGRNRRTNLRVSTEELGVRGYARLIEQVSYFAVTELGVEIPSNTRID